MFGPKGFLLVVLVLALGACNQTPVGPEPLDFASDPRILRGAWTGQSEGGHTLRLTAEASEPTAEGYTVSGTFRLDDREPVAFTGGVRVPVAEAVPALSAQTSPVCPGDFFAYSEGSMWEFCGDAPTGSPPRFAVSLLDQSSTGRVYSLSVTKDVVEANVLVSGKIVYRQGEPYTHPEPFRFTEDSHAVVQLWYSWSALGDAPGELVAETTLEDISSFPLEYRLEGDAEAVFARRGDYFLQVEVFSGAGDEAVVGDLVSEFYTPVPSPGATVEVRVTGLEP